MHYISSFLYALTGVLLFTIIYSILSALYNLYLHPLRNFPGPKIRAASEWPYFWSLFRGYAPQYMLDLHTQYGPVVRVAPNELTFNTAGAFRDIYGQKKQEQAELTKDKKYISGMGEPTLLHSDKEYHAYLRKMMAPGFSDGALRKQEVVVKEYLGLLVEKLEEESQRGKRTVDLLEWVNFFVFDVVGHLTYTESFDCLTTSTLHPWVTKFTKLGRPMAYAQAAERLPKLLRLPFMALALDKSILSDRNTVYKISEAKVQHRLTKPTHFPDFLGNLIQSHRDGKMTLNQLNSNAVFLMAAGTETLVTSVVHTIYRLLTNKHTLAKLTAEIRGAFATPDDINMTGVNKCKYLLACLEENLRIQAPSPATHPRFTPKQGVYVDGYWVPGGAAVGVPIHAACNSRRNFSEPDKYAPERWMMMPGSSSDANEYAGDTKSASQVFSLGPRDCLGRTIATAMMRLIVAHLVWHFDLEQCFPDNWAEQKVYLVWEKPPLPVKLHPAAMKKEM
ncbi:averantin oxidoreductase [Pyrenophora seminiperda CCB06]|uniref:Averantin oxidoreductase n=1 Tax=Pyrenophora seminiperda CCB06 TaxID=1302712 RepID=A0A3M7MEC5_9PLEO|nr:averantin oxidoreductase [Pyrenophora seminiperda CCB06]